MNYSLSLHVIKNINLVPTGELLLFITMGGSVLQAHDIQPY